MDKKNTILLTVIAIATLLVAVVGATFAYYSVQVSAGKTDVNVNATAGSVGLLTLDSPVENLYMTVTPTDMADYGSDKHYYAKDTNEVNENSSNKSDTKQEYVISKLEVKGGEPSTGYTCNAKLKITLDVADGSMGSVLKSGDVKLHLTGDNVDITDFKNDLDLNEILTSGTTIESQNQKYKEFDITYHLNGTEKTIAQIKATLELINKTASGIENTTADQKYLAGKNLNVTIQIVSEGDKLDCSINSNATE